MPTRPCRWFAAGKHPCAKDFFTVGEGFPLAESLYRWIAAGYEPTLANGSCTPSWRFWAGGGDLLAYGILKDSFDSFGRRFPLLVMGQVRVKGWEMAWDRIPEGLAESWACMEAIAAARLQDLSTLKEQIRGDGINRVALGSPSLLAGEGRGGGTCWTDVSGEGWGAPCLSRLPTAAVEGAFAAGRLVEAALRHDHGLVSIHCSAEGTHAETIAVASHAALKQKVQKAPGSVFIGGVTQHPRILFFYRPLAASDFSMLWLDDAGAEDGAK